MDADEPSPDDPEDRPGWLERRWPVLAGIVLALGVAAFTLARLRVAASWGLGAVCGNGVVETGEECDDGNDVLTDGCSIGCVGCPNTESSFASPAGHCYWREPNPLPFEAAAEVCRQKKGYLVTYAVDLEWREVTDHLFKPARKDS